MAMAATASSSLTYTTVSLLKPHSLLLRASGYTQELSRLQFGVQHDVYRPNMDSNDVCKGCKLQTAQMAKESYSTRHPNRNKYSYYCPKAEATTVAIAQKQKQTNFGEAEHQSPCLAFSNKQG